MTAAVPPREELLRMPGYTAGAQVPDTIRLNANEAPEDMGDGRFSVPLNRYPDVLPWRLRRRMAEVLGVGADNLLVTRGSSEAIDVLVRTYCRAYEHGIVTMPPTFEMYGFYAAVQGAGLTEVPLDADNDFQPDFAAVTRNLTEKTRLLIVCTPNNPTGSVVPADEVLALATHCEGSTIVVVDEAYIEFSDRESLATIAQSRSNLVVLRTLSKAQGLAGARCGAAIANADVIELLGRVLPPYAFPTPVVDAVLDALTASRMAAAKKVIATVRRERDRVYAALCQSPCIDKTWPSQGNFLLARFRDPERARACFDDAHILVRDYSNKALLKNCMRITVGSRHENDALLGAIATIGK